MRAFIGDKRTGKIDSGGDEKAVSWITVLERV